MMNQLNELMNFDILKNCGKHNNGIIIIQNTNSRYYLYNNLAKRTLGYFVNETKPVGLEGAYNYYLKGESIKILMKNITNKVLIPINNFAINKYLIDIPKGNDIISSINISIQDMIHQIMLKSLISNDADWGTAILMEVNTGYIRAIVNLSKENENIYIEKYNYAIGFSCEPGSVFKLPSIMVGLEDNKFNIYDNVDSSNEIIFYGVKISNASKNNKINNLITAFAKSSNVAIAKIITDYYHKNPIQFINRLKSFGLNNKLENIDIPGSGKVFITSPSNKNWSNLSLPCMSYGYGISLTPLQILTFYNAIANNGNMVKPLFVTAIKNNLDKTIQNVEIESINNNIASNNTIKNAQVLLKSVIQNGTGKHLRSAKCAISGKTGTTIIFNQKHGYNNVKKQYRSSFCGYFPSDAPLYSITVMISNPKNGKYYSSDIVLPIIKEITDKIILKEMQYYIDIDTLPIISNNNFVK
ncbi:MAG: hypothetical protein IR527_00685 [Bacteroides sp.]|nr:MAG: hypothetical protein IR527_00685 [Bacteroides sp.]